MRNQCEKIVTISGNESLTNRSNDQFCLSFLRAPSILPSTFQLYIGEGTIHLVESYLILISMAKIHSFEVEIGLFFDLMKEED